MSNRSQVLRGTARASVGLVASLAAVGAVVALGTMTVPTVERTPPVVNVDTAQHTKLRLVCAGSFSMLGADVERPNVAVPIGTPKVTVTGDPEETAELSREEGSNGLPSTFLIQADQPLAAAQAQTVSAESGRGLATSACASPLNDQWLLGGDTMLGVTTTLSLGNPTEVPATAQITVYDENGQVADYESAAVRVSPGSETTVSINGYATDRERVAVHVASSGAPVTAFLGVSHVVGLDPLAVSSVTRQTEPAQTLVFPGAANVEDHGDAPTHGHDHGSHLLVRLLAPAKASGEAEVFAVDKNGKRTSLGTLELESNRVAELEVELWPTGAEAVVVESEVPVIGGVQGSADSTDKHDYAWFSPAPELRAGVPAATAVVTGGTLVLVNVGSRDAEVQVVQAGSDKEPTLTTVPAGAAMPVTVPAGAVLTSGEPLHAGVRAFSDGFIDGYPILSESQRGGELKVYVR